MGASLAIFLEATGNGAAGDIFGIAMHAPTVCPTGGILQAPVKVCDATQLGLAPAPNPESEIDALDMGSSCGVISVPYRIGEPIGARFSLDPFTASGMGLSPADILYQPTPGAPQALVVYANAAALGLQANDDIDALAVYDAVNPGVLGPGDIVYVSLKALSPTLISTGMKPGDVIEVFPASPPVVVMTAAQFGLQPGDELDALTIFEPVADGNGDQSFRIYNHSPETIVGAGQTGTAVQLMSDDFDGGPASCTLVFGAPVGIGGSSVHANVFPATQYEQDDPCATNLSCALAFFDHSNVTYGCGGFPAQPAVPDFPTNPFHNEVRSFPIPLVNTNGNRVDLEFDVYTDMRLDALVFYRYRVRFYVGGNPTPWRSVGSFYGRNTESGAGERHDWIHVKENIGALIPAGATTMEFAIGAIDMKDAWVGVYGSGTCHSHAPLIDNVTLTHVEVYGPQWYVRDTDLFHDTFPDDGTITGTIRSDPAEGDEVVVRVSDLEHGVGTDPLHGGPAVYLLVSVRPPQPGKTGSPLTDDPVRFPVVATMIHAGFIWDVIRMDVDYHAPGIVNPQHYTVDLAENLFEPGDEVRFVFRATSAAGFTTYWSQFTEATDNMALALAHPMEFSALPGQGFLSGGDILYVDNHDFRGSQGHFQLSFQAMGLSGLVDRFDIRGGDAIQNNGLASRVYNAQQQLTPVYRKILWDSGDLPYRTMGMGPYLVTDDAVMLAQWLYDLPADGGLYMCGDNLPSELAQVHPGSLALRTWIDYAIGTPSHATVLNTDVPRVIAAPGSCFDHALGPDTLLADAACEPVHDFDVMIPGPAANLEMSYLGQGAGAAAVVSQRSINSVGSSVGVILSGFGFGRIRSDHTAGENDAAHHLYDIIQWLGNNPAPPVGADPVRYVNSLEPNVPNPFNPSTRIRYSIAKPSRVDLRVYDVSGRLVRRLVRPDAIVSAGAYEVSWDGTADNGQRVVSGVYFYRIRAGAFTESRKMVLLK
jgi:hypothetical protein